MSEGEKRIIQQTESKDGSKKRETEQKMVKTTVIKEKCKEVGAALFQPLTITATTTTPTTTPTTTTTSRL